MSDAAERRRLRAVDPDASVWVAASAGTGKTTILTDRLLSLMLDGTDPGRILCLTFTRAAAAEMSIRLNRRLSEWATLPPGALAQQLVGLTGRQPDAAAMARARQLFASVLDTPGGTKIQTIHAFCQSLLRRFPLEAGVAPEFVVMDERSAAEALAEAGKSLLAAVRDGADPGLAEALTVVARYAPEEHFAKLMGALVGERGKLRRALVEGEEALRLRLAAALSLPADATADSLCAAFCAPDACGESGLRGALEALLAGSDKDRARGRIIEAWCADPAGRQAMLEAYLPAFLTKDGEILDTLITKNAAAKAAVDARSILEAEAARVVRFREARAGAVVLAASCALARLGAALLDAYEERKARQGLLDYDDLVEQALALLRRPGLAPWVLYKLDGGLDHILIDEAQDTNPEQWAIVAALAEEFFAGEEARRRTVFAVGDVKQSIYSFQRADPQAFLRMREHFQQRVDAARRRWEIVPLDISFRAAEPLLQAIDAVFGSPAAADGVALDHEAIRHVAHRLGHAGLVELWPPVMPDPEEPLDATSLPVEIRRATAPRTKLARAIAERIARWLAEGERLPARGRALRAGDIMVLVRRRNEFVTDLLRELKQRGIPVAGADRLVLTAQLAVQDLVALGRFLLLPDDDLTLATVLKGPLFNLSEEMLFDLAYGRGEKVSLWSRLRRRSGEDLLLHETSERLSALLRRADFVPPYELYAEILGAGGGRRAMLERLGPEAADPIEEFLALALAYEREHAPSLQGFLRWLVARETEVKRDFAERQRDELRIMTVHGAKGLEAPVVFLPDTMALPDPRASLLWTESHDLPLWRPRAEFAAPAFAAERAALCRRQLQEYRRLLYVALTRAEDRLYVCGWQARNMNQKEPNWHALCRSGWAGTAAPFAFDSSAWIGGDGWGGEGLRIEGAQHAAVKPEGSAGRQPHRGALPRWAMDMPPPEPDPPKPLLPSRPSGEEPAAVSPLKTAGRDRFKRGLLVHRLLQSLPELPEAERETAARRFLARPLHALAWEERDEICRETLAVLQHPDFAALWGPGSQAEVPLVGLIGGHALSGQIDRLVVTDDAVLIVDFKTLRPPPQRESDVPAVYLRQLAIYREALGRIYRGRDIRCALLWTDGPCLMPIAEDTLGRLSP
ncbi:MAG TPA: double-strand break repair helicase AddA [Stellaceae bacterium]|nr:double-strand break repair helicase AddA [Stellaceae bacterium]